MSDRKRNKKKNNKKPLPRKIEARQVAQKYDRILRDIAIEKRGRYRY